MELLNSAITSLGTSEGISEGAGAGASDEVDKLLRVVAFCDTPKTKAEIQGSEKPVKSGGKG